MDPVLFLPFVALCWFYNIIKKENLSPQQSNEQNVAPWFVNIMKKKCLYISSLLMKGLLGPPSNPVRLPCTILKLPGHFQSYCQNAQHW